MKTTQTFSQQWTAWLADLNKMREFNVDRCMKPASFGQVRYAQLHHFAYASESGYGTVSYLRLENHHKEVRVHDRKIQSHTIKTNDYSQNGAHSCSPSCQSRHAAAKRITASTGQIHLLDRQHINNVLKSVLNQQMLDDEGLQTLLCEAEAILNDRPITKMSGNVGQKNTYL